MSEFENFPPCANCGHDAEFHDDEFGNCFALPNRYGLAQRDGCDCPGYSDGENE
jgi:hypothetical protein